MGESRRVRGCEQGTRATPPPWGPRRHADNEGARVGRREGVGGAGRREGVRDERGWGQLRGGIGSRSETQGLRILVTLENGPTDFIKALILEELPA